MTNQKNVNRTGTFENNIACILSEDIAAIGRNGFGPLENLLRRVLFASDTNSIDWMEVADLLAKNNPERAVVIERIKMQRGKNWKEAD